ncbi:MAG: hypothetical protein WCY00_02710 [Candidatus Dojkabacteria bacterium]
MKYKLKLKNDLFYLFVILLITQIFNHSVLSSSFSFLLILGFLGLMLLETWFIKTFRDYSSKKISKYSDVIVKISLKKRFFGYFILPAIFYISLLIFLYFNRNMLLGHVVLGVCTVLLLILFLNVKSSLNRIYSFAIATRAVFDFMCITIFYLLLNSFVRIGVSMEIFTVLLSISALILLIFVLRIHDRLGPFELLIAIFSSLFIAMFNLFFWNYNIFVIPAVGTLAFYLIISLWNVRFAGKIKLLDYLIPFFYVVIAIILILTL